MQQTNLTELTLSAQGLGRMGMSEGHRPRTAIPR